LKSNFNESISKAQANSKKSLIITRDENMRDKKTLERRLHEQNSEQNAFIKESSNEKIDSLSAGYESKIKALDLKNKLSAQNANIKVRDVRRQATAEIDRQRKESISSAKSQIATERKMAGEREKVLNDRIVDITNNFAVKTNAASVRSRKKVSDVKHNAEQSKIVEANRYQDIIDQNTKFSAREIDRLKVANDSEKKRIIGQYDDRIRQMEKALRSKTEEFQNFKIEQKSV